MHQINSSGNTNGHPLKLEIHFDLNGSVRPGSTRLLMLIFKSGKKIIRHFRNKRSIHSICFCLVFFFRSFDFLYKKRHFRWAKERIHQISKPSRNQSEAKNSSVSILGIFEAETNTRRERKNLLNILFPFWVMLLSLIA